MHATDGAWKNDRADSFEFVRPLVAAAPMLAQDVSSTRSPEEIVEPYQYPAPPNPGVLATSNFAGSFDCRSKDATSGGQSTYDGAAIVTMLDCNLVASVLAPGLELAQSTPAGATEHPVILLLGRQKDLYFLEDGGLIPAEGPYTELILIVPYTVKPPGTKWHNYVVRMYLDNVDAIVIGDVIYAYAKEKATFTARGDMMSVMRNGSTMFESRVEATGPAINVAPGQAPPPGFADLQQVFEMPIVGYFGAQPPAPVPGGWRFSCSYFEWDFSNATAAPAASKFTFVKEFKPGMQGWVDLGQLANAPEGAFKIRGLRWRLSLELPLVPPNMPPACTFT